MSLLEIESARLYLRPFREEDIVDLHRLWTNPDVRKHLWDDEVIALEQTARAVRQSIECAERQDIGMWCVFAKAAGEMMGFCGFRFVSDSSELELLYGLLPEYWGQGFATEAARAALTFAFNMHPYERILAGADAANLTSFRVMQRLGMCPLVEGIAAALSAIYYEIRRAEFAPDLAVVWR